MPVGPRVEVEAVRQAADLAPRVGVGPAPLRRQAEPQAPERLEGRLVGEDVGAAAGAEGLGPDVDVGPGRQPRRRGVAEGQAGVGAPGHDPRLAAVQHRRRDDRPRSEVELPPAGRGEGLPTVVVDERLGPPGADGDLHQRPVRRHAHLDPVDLVVLGEVHPFARERRVVGEPDPVGGEKAPAPHVDPLGDPVRDPVLVGDRPRAAEGGVPPDGAVRGPPVAPPGGLEIEVHQEVAVRYLAAGHIDVDVGGPDVETELQRALAVEQAEEEALLARGAPAGPLPAEGRDLFPRQRPPVRREESAPRSRIVAGGAAGVLLRQERRLGGRDVRSPPPEKRRQGGEGDDPRATRPAQPCRSRHGAPSGGAAPPRASKVTVTSTASRTPTPR